MARRKRNNYLPKARLCVVIWEDAYIAASHQDNAQGFLDGVKPVIRYSPGWYVGESGGCIIIATDLDYHDGVTYGGRVQIPIAMKKRLVFVT